MEKERPRGRKFSRLKESKETLLKKHCLNLVFFFSLEEANWGNLKIWTEYLLDYMKLL